MHKKNAIAKQQFSQAKSSGMIRKGEITFQLLSVYCICNQIQKRRCHLTIYENICTLLKEDSSRVFLSFFVHLDSISVWHRFSMFDLLMEK